MDTGEDKQALRKILDLTRMISIAILAIHLYIICYQAFSAWTLVSEISDRLASNMYRLPVFQGLWKAKLAALLCLLISLIGTKGKKNEKARYKPALLQLACGLVIYLLAFLTLYMPFSINLVACGYMITTTTGYLLVLSGGVRLSRLIRLKLNKDIFNRDSETFPQEERLLANEYSINLPAKYNLKGKIKDSWINVLNPFRGLLIAGTPGAGKSYFVVRHIIDQHIKKGFSMFLYDFKFDDLSRLAYNKLLKYCSNYPVKPKFYVISLDEIYHRANPLDPGSMEDITDAAESARTIMLGLNRDWIKKQGDFFVESAVNFVTAVIWYLRKYRDGRYCTLPHVIELIQLDYERLFAVLKTEKEIQALISPFVSALEQGAAAQLEGQIASAKIGLARLASPQLYYVLTGNDFTLDINNPKAPKIICVGNNPQKLQTYGAVLSLYISRMVKLVNRKGQLKSSLIFDEFPTIFLNNMDSLIATARSNKVSTTLAVQDFSQLSKDYGSDQSKVITGIVGNIISGQVTGETAKRLSETFGKIMQDRESVSINSSDVSVSKSKQLDFAIPPARISSLSSGEFVGMVADNPDQRIELKMFHAEIQNDHDGIAQEAAGFESIPKPQKATSDDVHENYLRVRREIQDIVENELVSISKAKDAAAVKRKKTKTPKGNNSSRKPPKEGSEQRSISY
ncbi:conjugal transfer protein MobC [Pedobacter deserti]|uniref:conjugal transfer protein MobC n=1 Tax=Pedobacter deserti TaxID=2817382 RepID=UPI00210AADED|nr:conjugal transfer protein MobC [Pedobacter sp. SYSU D00382]